MWNVLRIESLRDVYASRFDLVAGGIQISIRSYIIYSAGRSYVSWSLTVEAPVHYREGLFTLWTHQRTDAKFVLDQLDVSNTGAYSYFFHSEDPTVGAARRLITDFCFELRAKFARRLIPFLRRSAFRRKMWRRVHARQLARSVAFRGLPDALLLRLTNEWL